MHPTRIRRDETQPKQLGASLQRTFGNWDQNALDKLSQSTENEHRQDSLDSLLQ